MSKDSGLVFEINGKLVSPKGEPFLMAEIACSHDGDPERVRLMIDAVADSEADGIQFQIFKTENLLVPNHKFYNLVEGLEIPYSEWGLLIRYAISKSLTVSVNILDESGLRTAVDAGAHAIKLHSADLSNPRVFKIVSEEKLPLIISTGGSTINEIQKAVKVAKTSGIQNILLMHGFQAFPTEVVDNHLNYIETLSKNFDFPLGFQDHMDGSGDLATIVPLMALAKGYCFIEKHITDDRLRKGTDFESSLGPANFVTFAKNLRQGWLALGESERGEFSEAELKYRATFKKSIIAIRDIKKGEEIKDCMYQFMRGDLGLPPTEVASILGRRAKETIKKYESITLESLD